MGIPLLPDTIAGFEAQFGESEVQSAAAVCGLEHVAHRALLTVDQRTALFHALRLAAAQPPAEVPASEPLPDTAERAVEQASVLQSPAGEEAPEPASSQGPEPVPPPLDGAVPEAPPAPDAGNDDSLRQLVAEHEEQLARLKASRSRIAAQLKEAKQTVAEQAAEIRALRRKLSVALRAGERQRLITQRAEARVARLQIRLDEQRETEQERIGTALSDAERTIAALRDKLSQQTKRRAAALRSLPKQRAQHPAPRGRPRKKSDLSPVDAWAARVADQGAGFSVETPVVVLGHGPVSYRSMKARLVAQDMDTASPGDPSAAVVVVGRDGWFIDDIEAQIRARSGEDLFIYSQEMFLAALEVGSDPFETARAHELLAFAKDHPALTACREEGFLWPKINTSRVARLLEQTVVQADRSPLRELGYHVGFSSDLDAHGRRQILRRCFTGDLPHVHSDKYMKSWGTPRTRGRLRRMANTIHWLLLGERGRLERANMSRAIDHRTADLDWMKHELYEDWMAFRWPGTGSHSSGPRVPGSARQQRAPAASRVT
jgi:hypothetical protein